MFSICIPNYNYEKYLGITIKSILNQSLDDYEICIADNRSTDKSVDVIEGFLAECKKDIRYIINPANIGFAGNLDKAGNLGKGDFMIMLSSDDVIKEPALELYSQVIRAFSGDKKIVISSCIDTIDQDGKILKKQQAKDFRFGIWSEDLLDRRLSHILGCGVYRAVPGELLARCMLTGANPFNFCATCFPKESYDKVGGYGAGRLVNPDKWFHWKLLTVVDEVVFIDQQLFQYRWHNQNQTAQQASTGHLKYLIDEYRNTIEVTPEMLKCAGMGREDFIKSFVKQVIYRHGIGEFLKGKWLKALRIYFFGLSVYPGKTFSNLFFLPYTLALCSTPLGSKIAQLLTLRR